MKIIVTGAAGFIGSNLCMALLAENFTIVGIDNLSHGNMANLSAILQNKNFTFIQADLLDDSTSQYLDGDVIVHLASQKIPRYSSAYRTLSDNTIMLRRVLNACREKKMKIVYASTSDVYGKNPVIPYHEQSDLLLGPTTVKRWAYALSKIHGEQFIIAHQEEFGVEYSILRFFGSYGPNQNTTWWGGPQAVFIQNILEGKPIEIHGDGLQTRTFTFVSDTIQGIVKSITHEAAKNQIFNIAGEMAEEITIVDLSKLILQLMNQDENYPVIKIPYSTFGNYEDVMRRVPDISKIKNMLGFSPKFFLREGMQITIDWQTKLHSTAKT